LAQFLSIAYLSCQQNRQEPNGTRKRHKGQEKGGEGKGNAEGKGDAKGGLLLHKKLRVFGSNAEVRKERGKNINSRLVI